MLERKGSTDTNWGENSALFIRMEELPSLHHYWLGWQPACRSQVGRLLMQMGANLNSHGFDSSVKSIRAARCGWPQMGREANNNNSRLTASDLSGQDVAILGNLGQNNRSCARGEGGLEKKPLGV